MRHFLHNVKINTSNCHIVYVDQLLNLNASDKQLSVPLEKERRDVRIIRKKRGKIWRENKKEARNSVKRNVVTCEFWKCSARTIAMFGHECIIFKLVTKTIISSFCLTNQITKHNIWRCIYYIRESALNILQNPIAKSLAKSIAKSLAKSLTKIGCKIVYKIGCQNRLQNRLQDSLAKFLLFLLYAFN